MDRLWNLLRPPYRWLLRRAAGSRGLDIAIGGQRLRLHPRFADNSWEMIETESYGVYVRLIRPCDTIYDIGAHIGTYTVIGAKLTGPKGHVIAYEPHDVTRRFLTTHLKWNGVCNRVTVRDVCLGAQAGWQDFYYGAGAEAAEGMNGLVPVEGFQKKGVRVATLDEEIECTGLSPNLVKVDVEGGEWDVLQGAQQTLARCRPTLLLSVHPPALAKIGITPERLFSFLAAQGYQTRVLAQDHEMHVLASHLKGKP